MARGSKTRQQNCIYDADEAAKREQKQQQEASAAAKGSRSSRLLQKARKTKGNKAKLSLEKGRTREDICRPGGMREADEAAKLSL